MVPKKASLDRKVEAGSLWVHWLNKCEHLQLQTSVGDGHEALLEKIFSDSGTCCGATSCSSLSPKAGIFIGLPIPIPIPVFYGAA
jgi:hypothetical protein